MPNGVKEEILSPDEEKIGISELKNCNWIRSYNIKNEMIYSFAQDLDKGELEVIMAAKELNITNVLIDEKLGRLLAKHLSLDVMGTLGYLLLLKKKDLITKIKPLIQKLQDNNIWISDKKKIIFYIKLTKNNKAAVLLITSYFCTSKLLTLRVILPAAKQQKYGRRASPEFGFG